MVKLYAQCRISGTAFSPREAAKHLSQNVQLKNAIEPGEIARSGRFAGKPLPEGRLTVSATNGDLDGLLAVLPEVVPVLRRLEAESIVLFLDIEFEEQCNWELTVKQLEQIARSGVTMAISCYPSEDRGGTSTAG